MQQELVTKPSCATSFVNRVDSWFEFTKLEWYQLSHNDEPYVAPSTVMQDNLKNMFVISQYRDEKTFQGICAYEFELRLPIVKYLFTYFGKAWRTNKVGSSYERDQP